MTSEGPGTSDTNRSVDERHPIAAIVIGGMVGSLLRAGADELLPVHAGSWPWPTFLVNIVGCFVIGVVVTRHDHYDAAPHWRPFLGTGLAGGLTTFSTLQVEVLNLLDDGHGALAAAYVATSVVLGLAAVSVATWLVHRTHGEATA